MTQPSPEKTNSTNYNPIEFKKHFPLFDQPEHQSLMYFDNAATTQTPQQVIDAIANFYLSANANVHRASHELARKATDIFENTRQKLAHYIQAKSEDIIFCRGATEGLNLLASILEHQCNPGDQIVLSPAEHHANLLPWQQLAYTKQMDIVFLPLKSGKPDLNTLPELLSPKTKIVSLALASNVLGYRIPIEQYRSLLQSTDCYFILDAAQALAHEKVNVTDLGCDFLVGSAHKMFGPFGIGFVYGKNAVLETLPPYQRGGEMIRGVTPTSADFAKAPYKFEAGTMPLADIAGFGAALDFAENFDRKAIQAHEYNMCLYFHDALGKKPEISLITEASNNVGITTFAFTPESQLNTSDLALWLDEHHVAVRVGQHCAQPLYQALGQQHGLRISVAPYNTLEECTTLIKLIHNWIHINVSQSEQATEIKIQPMKKNIYEFFQIKDFSDLSHSQEKYKKLMMWGNQIQRKPHIQQAQFKINGCEANTWLTHKMTNQKHYFTLDSESRIVRGLGALMLSWFQGRSTEDILEFDWKAALVSLGLTQQLSSSRANGLKALIDRSLELIRV